jgi:argininosuccinate lyase
MAKEESGNLWGGRFTGGTDEGFARFNSSFAFDRRLFTSDIEASRAHGEALRAAGVLTDAEATAIDDGLCHLLAEHAARGESYFDEMPSEDVHSFIERRLVEAIGDAGRKLHTGRSRNDQVATALRLFMRGETDETVQRVRDLQRAVLDLAARHHTAVIPGYTHLQRAQPVLFAHWCLAYFEMLERDAERFTELRARANTLPLGAAALAGTSHPIDRERVAARLGFARVARNSLDAVSDRDFLIEFASAASLVQVHLSRLAEDIILYATTEFNFIELSDRIATGSSLMPQKKNPDAMELVRGKAGRVFGSLQALLVMMKGLPLAYNKDLQEDKEAIFDVIDTVNACLEVSATVLGNLRVREDVTREAASKGYMNATELADYLVRKGAPFRDAHETVGRMVLTAIARGVELEELSLELMRAHSPLIEPDVYEALSLEKTLSSKRQTGGTAPERVREELAYARKQLDSNS